ncbi:MAG: hypothetical protein ACPF8W_00080 [Luminiphilus sp.]|jgi:rubrerythrin
MRRIFDQDPMTGITRYWHMRDNGEFVIETQQDVQSLFDMNKRDQNNQKDGWGDGRHVARIPLPVYYDLKRKGIIDDPKAFMKWLSDSENERVRTKTGRLI